MDAKIAPQGVTIVRDFAAAAEKINETYVGRVLRLTLLAPEIVETILHGRQQAGLQLEHLMKRFPVEWSEQRTEFHRRRA